MANENEVKQSVATAAQSLLDMAPDVIQETLSWALWDHGFGALLFLLLTAGSIWLGCRMRRGDMPEVAVVCWGTAICFGLLSTVQACGFAHVVIAPRSYLLEKVLQR